MKLNILLLFVMAPIIKGKIVLFLDEKVEICSEPGNEANLFNYENLEVLILSDTEIFLNGSIKVLRDIESPWKGLFTAEKNIRNQWNIQCEKKYPDLCESIHDPAEFTYKITKTLPKCSIAADVRCLET